MTGADDLARELADLRARLIKLERSAQLGRSSVTDDDDNDLDVVTGISTAYAASLGVADALEAAYDAQATADGERVIYFDEKPPTGDLIDYGDWWVPSPGTAVYLYDGDSWQLAPDQSLAGVFARAANAQDTADGKIISYWQSTLPLAASEGDLCFLAPTNTPYRWQLGGWVLLVQGQVQSAGYDPGNAGWAFDSDSTQVPNLNVIGVLGAGQMTAESVTLNGFDLQADLIDPLPDGAIGFGSNASGANAGDVSTTRIPLFAYNLGSVTGGRLLRIHIRGHFQATDAGGYDLSIGYTNDGTDPVDGGVILDGSLTRVNFATGATGTLIQPFDIWAYYAPGADFEQVRMKLFGQRVNGAGTGSIYLADPNRKLIWLFEDIGSRSAANVGVLAQKTPALDADPVSMYSRTWLADWSRSFDASGATRADDDTADMYQGYEPVHGRTKSLCGFDDADIRSKLAGATVLSVRLTFRVKYRAAADGLDVYVNAHDYDLKPAIWDNSHVTQAITARQDCNEGVTYTITLPPSVGAQLKSGTVRGFGFGPGPDDGADNFGWLYGQGSDYRPKLTIQYRK